MAVAAIATAAAAGCAIRTTAPIREVAYDFSDYDFYDRAYAPSPRYAETYVEYGEPPPTVVVVPAGPAAGSAPAQPGPAASDASPLDTSKPTQRIRRPIVRVRAR